MRKLILFAILLCPLLCTSQNSNPPPPGVPVPALTINSILNVLIISGVVYGMYSIGKKK